MRHHLDCAAANLCVHGPGTKYQLGVRARHSAAKAPSAAPLSDARYAGVSAVGSLADPYGDAAAVPASMLPAPRWRMKFAFRKRPLVIGHRGSRCLYPGNTLPGFCGAIALGV